VWLWLTVLFGNFAEVVAEDRGKTQAACCLCAATYRPRGTAALNGDMARYMESNRTLPVTKTMQGCNLVLATLPTAQRRSLVAHCERVQLRVGDVLCEQGERLSHVYFPIDSAVSVISSIDERSRLEVELVGAEGMVGGFLMLGANIASGRCLVQVSGASL
jgi:hypothetical protein